MKKIFSCFRVNQTPREKKVPETAAVPGKRYQSHDSQYDFLSICSGLDEEDDFDTPISSMRGSIGAASINHHTLLVNGVRYHPYSVAFGYNPGLVQDESAVPYDFSVYDKLEHELQLWVCNRYKDPPAPLLPLPLPQLADVHALIRTAVAEIEKLADEGEEVIRPMDLLEKLRHSLSDPSGLDKFNQVSEDERFKGLDFLVSYPLMQKLRWKYPRIKTVMRIIATIPKREDKTSLGWHYEEHSGIDLWTRAELDGSFSVMGQSVQMQPLFNAISLINEVDLHPLFMPHLAKATRVHQMTGCGKRAQILARYVYQMPMPFSNRDTVLFAFGCNAVKVKGVEAIIISAHSVPPNEKDWWGYSVPPADRMVREQVRGMSFILKPLDAQRTSMTVIANLDKRIAFLPQSFVNWIIKDMIRGLYKNMIKLNLKFDKTQFAKRVIDNPEFYEWVTSLIGQCTPSS